MSLICPVCNGLGPLVEICQHCQTAFADMGRLDNFLEPYAAYEENELLQAEGAGVYEGYCQHLLQCPICGRRQRVRIELLPM